MTHPPKFSISDRKNSQLSCQHYVIRRRPRQPLSYSLSYGYNLTNLGAFTPETLSRRSWEKRCTLLDFSCTRAKPRPTLSGAELCGWGYGPPRTNSLGTASGQTRQGPAIRC